MRKTQVERDRADLERRLEVLKLPVVPLEHHGFLTPLDRAEMERDPEAVGVGPDGTAFAVWPHREDSRRKQVTWHFGGKEIAGAIDVETDLRVSFVQPLPEGRVVLAAARARHGTPNGEVWTRDGVLKHRGNLGDAIEELQTTPSGKVWAGYFDEGALGGAGPEGHGLARFNQDLTVDWLYPRGAGLPYISDCYTLNLHGETAHFCPYTDFHIQSASGDKVTDWGASAYQFADSMLVSGADRALLRGSGSEYDVVTLLRIDRDGVRRVGGQCRIVLPDGIEAQRLRYTCRGGDLHAFDKWGKWYRTGFDALSAVAGAAEA
ncbi:hypothetical protein I0C86_20930 [Plantactinospora sp. S1510]|uniref:Uncharacterized protein n=1 Tax=Plantactinospora alkalitolerans TaxID=2789879 RepID=A0ABS0GYZ1_9ACTN|nr:hypothetical protein [Plantactinospora alkalitolerans]MBF9131407.1 hypothetical protein [Plantactinospora alkalitolerans]